MMAKAVGLAVGTMILIGLGGQAATAQSGTQPLAKTNLEQILTGNTLVGSYPNGRTFAAFLAANGSMRERTTDFQQSADRGRWQAAEPDQFCQQWDHRYDKARYCTTLHQAGDTYYEYDAHGRVLRNFRIEPGNTAKLAD